MSSRAPDKCLYCNGDDPNCGFCDLGKPLDTQADWDRTWGRVLHPSHPYVPDPVRADTTDMSDTTEWERLMTETVEAHNQQTADYQPGTNQVPGSGSEGDDPLGLHYADLGPLAFALNEALDSKVNTGTDRESLLEQIAQAAGDAYTVADVEEVLTDDEHCPDMAVIQAFANTLSIDAGSIIDAAEKGGCTNLGPIPAVPPGY